LAQSCGACGALDLRAGLRKIGHSANPAEPPMTPKRPLPPGACDTHAHLFGPTDRFPFVIPVPYEPPHAPLESYLAVLDSVGLTRGVAVTPVTYEFDNSSVVDACRRAPERIRGVGVTSPAVTDRELAEMAQAGIKGFRFSGIDADAGDRYGSAGLEDFHRLAPRLKTFGLHGQIWAYAHRIAEDAERILSHGVPVVIDHLTRPDVARGVKDAGFQRIVALVREGRVWVKLALSRVGRQFPDYQDARPFHDALVSANPDMLMWGSDWPHVRQGDRTPDIGHLLDLLDEWLGHDEGLRRRILADNPQRCYGFPG
jgi:predicted TIM-barrel fold metal-dependent hydrolase